MVQQIYYYIIFSMIFILITSHCYKNYLSSNIHASINFVEGFQENFKEGLKFPKVSDIKNSILGPLKPMIDFFKKLPKRLTSINSGLKDIFYGIGDEFKYLGIGTARGVSDISLLFAYISQFVFSYTMCGVKYMSNMPSCLLYYSVDTTFNIMHLPIRISLWLLQWSIGLNLYPIQDKIWKWLLQLNGYIYGSLGFNIIRWPKNVRDQCYNCKRLKLSVLARKGKDIDYDFKVNIPKILKKGINRIKRGGERIINLK